MRRVASLIALSLTLVAPAACGGSASPAAPSTTTTSTTTTTTTTTTPTTPTTPVPTKNVSYEGTFAGTSYVGTFTIAADIPVSAAARTTVAQTATTFVATCTYHFSGAAATNTISGTYDSATKSFSCGNATITISATIQPDASVTGTTKVQQPDGTQQSGVAAAAPKDAVVVPINMCGTFTGGSGGRLTLTVTGESVVGTAWDSTEREGTPVKGTFNTRSTVIRVSGSIGPDGTVTAEGLLTDNGVQQTFAKGTWSNTLGQTGTWLVSKGC